MCKATLIIVFLVMPRLLHAQSAANAEAAVYRARIDSLIPELRAAQRARVVADSMRDVRKLAAQREPYDSLAMAPFVVVTPRSAAPKVMPIFRSAFAERRALLSGLEAAPVVTLLVEQDSQHRAFRTIGNAPRHHIVSMYGADRELNRTIAANAIDDALMDLAPATIREWLVDGGMADGRDSKLVYRDLATSMSSYAKRCFAAVTNECVNALGLGIPFDSMRGYTQDELRALAIRRGGPSVRDRAQCRAGISERCMEILMAYGGPPLPLQIHARANFLMFALKRGGEGALARLSSSRGNVNHAIEASGRAPIQTLVGEWRAQLESRKPAANAGTAGAAVAVLGWTLVATLFAVRSTRRRLQ